MTRLMVKDLGLAMALAEHAHSAVPMGPWPRNLFNLHATKGRGLGIFQHRRTLSGQDRAGLGPLSTFLPDSL